MLFTSFRYLIFLTITVVLYYVVPVRMRLPLLLFASLYFYAVWDPFSLVWLLMIIVISYLAGIILSQTQDEQKKKQIAALSSGSMLLVLIAFKYKDVLMLSRSGSLFSHFRRWAIYLMSRGIRRKRVGILANTLCS